MADRLERLLNLVALLLETREPLSLDRIAHELGGYPDDEHNRRTAFERDKKALRDAGIAITGEQLPGSTYGYRIRPEDYFLDVELEPDERVALQLAVSSIRLGTAWGDEALRKLGDDLPMGSAPPLAALPNLDALPALLDAQRQRATVRFSYRGEARRVDPYGLLMRKGNWYLSGFDHDRGGLRNFRIDRIEGDVVAGSAGAFERPADFDPAAVLVEDPKLLGEGDETEALVSFDAATVSRALRELGHDSLVRRDDDGRALVRVRVVNRDAFRTWLFGFGEHALVVAPADLVSEIRAWLAGFAAAGSTP